MGEVGYWPESVTGIIVHSDLPSLVPAGEMDLRHR